MCEETFQGPWASLHHGLDEFHPQEDAPGGDVPRGKDLVLVVPLAQVGLYDPSTRLVIRERGPVMRRSKQHLYLVGIVGEEFREPAQVVDIPFLLEPHDKGRHGEDVVLAEKADGLPVIGRGTLLVDLVQGRLVGMFNAEQEPRHAGLLVKVENVGVADDIACPRRTHEGHANVLRDQGFEKGTPGRPGCRGVFVGEIEYLHAVFPVQSGNLGGERGRVAVSPASPESPLPTVTAGVGAAA